MAKTVGVKMVGGKPIKTLEMKGGQVVVLDEDAEKLRRVTLGLEPTIKAQLTALGTIEDDDGYQIADGLFGRVKAARKSWAAQMEDIIRPIRTGLDKLYTLNRTVDKPLATLEAEIEREMRAYKLKELERAREEAEQVEQERLRLEREALKAKSPAKQQAIAAQLEEVEAWQPEVVRGSHSAARPSRKVRITDMKAFCGAVAAGLIPEDCAVAVMPALNRYYKDDPETVEEWPGVEGYDDVSIVSR